VGVKRRVIFELRIIYSNSDDTESVTINEIKFNAGTYTSWCTILLTWNTVLTLLRCMPILQM